MQHQKILLFISLGVNLGLLGFFKYFGFFTESFAELLRGFGLQPNWWTLRIILPVGISFYTFQTLSYTIDIYRKQLEPTAGREVFADVLENEPDHIQPVLAAVRVVEMRGGGWHKLERRIHEYVVELFVGAEGLEQ